MTTSKTAPADPDNRIHEATNASSRRIHDQIERTRSDMDDTLEAIGEKLHPRHLLNQALASFQGDGRAMGRDALSQTKSLGKQVFREMRKHQVPALLCAVGVAWWLYEEFSEEDEDLPGLSPEASAIAGGAAAWDEDYDWSRASEPRETWQERARNAVSQMRESLLKGSSSARERLRSAARHLVGVSGRTREQIHNQWAGLREHSGSFVDARTGQPYDDSYGKSWDELHAADYIAAKDWSEEEEKSWGSKAEHMLEEMKSTLSDSTASAQQQLKAAACKLREFVGSTVEFASDRSRRTGDGIRRATSDFGRRTSDAGRRVGDQMQAGYARSRDWFAETLENHPLAMAAASLGLGLVAGVLLPETRMEDRLMGESADSVKEQARAMAGDAAERGRRVAERVGSEAVHQMREQGLAPDQMAQKAKAAASRVAETAREETKQETRGVAQHT